jgi:hypothetical protein
MPSIEATRVVGSIVDCAIVVAMSKRDGNICRRGSILYCSNREPRFESIIQADIDKGQRAVPYTRTGATGRKTIGTHPSDAHPEERMFSDRDESISGRAH